MDSAAQEMHAHKPCLPDPGKYFMIAMRHGEVELGCCINPNQIYDDATFAILTKAIRDAVKSVLAGDLDMRDFDLSAFSDKIK